MKTWFVFVVNGERYAVWANSIKEARQKLVDELGTGQGKFIGCQLYEMGKIKVDHYIHSGMNWFDLIISGTV